MGTTTSTNVLPYDLTNYTELIIYVFTAGHSNNWTEFHILKDMINAYNGNNYINGGGLTTTYLTGVTIAVSLVNAQVKQTYSNSSDVTSSAIMRVYAR